MKVTNADQRNCDSFIQDLLVIEKQPINKDIRSARTISNAVESMQSLGIQTRHQRERSQHCRGMTAVNISYVARTIATHLVHWPR